MTNPIAAAAIRAQPALPKLDNPAKTRDAAQQFEGLLIEQILETARTASDDPATGSMTGMAEQHLATMLAQKGGLGLANLIQKGLEKGNGVQGEAAQKTQTVGSEADS